MNGICFYLGLGLLGLSAFFIKGTSPYSSSGGSRYERRRQRRLVGMVLLVMAVLLSAFGMLIQYVATHPQ
jgi:hypothetical protein